MFLEDLKQQLREKISINNDKMEIKNTVKNLKQERLGDIRKSLNRLTKKQLITILMRNYCSISKVDILNIIWEELEGKAKKARGLQLQKMKECNNKNPMKFIQIAIDPSVDKLQEDADRAWKEVEKCWKG